MNYHSLHNQFVEKSISGRYITTAALTPIFESWSNYVQLQNSGKSVLGKDIVSCQLGNGSTKILIWSQMHGNESTTTKGLVDFITFLLSDREEAAQILNDYCFFIIPILNPDGAEAYTRVNANEVDLNRDFINLSQPESKLLMHVFTSFKPDYCFNLHDQRTIFSAGKRKKPATISFLAPSTDVAKTYNTVRLKAVALINTMNKALQDHIPGQIGRFDDAFNPNCVGDTFQSLNVPTILIEAGHFPHDYEREVTRKHIFTALSSAFSYANQNINLDSILEEYLKIPQNEPIYFDFIYKNITINYDSTDIITNFAIQFREELVEGAITFIGYIAQIGDLDGYYGHVEYDGQMAIYSDNETNIPQLNSKAHFFLDNTAKFVNGMVKK